MADDLLSSCGPPERGAASVPPRAGSRPAVWRIIGTGRDGSARPARPAGGPGSGCAASAGLAEARGPDDARVVGVVADRRGKLQGRLRREEGADGPLLVRADLQAQ